MGGIRFILQYSLANYWLLLITNVFLLIVQKRLQIIVRDNNIIFSFTFKFSNLLIEDPKRKLTPIDYAVKKRVREVRRRALMRELEWEVVQKRTMKTRCSKRIDESLIRWTHKQRQCSFPFGKRGLATTLLLLFCLAYVEPESF